MHREISHVNPALAEEINLPLYFLTAFLGLIIGADLWPVFTAWMSGQGMELTTWSREFYPGYRIVLIAAILGGARVLYTALEGLLEGRIGADLALAIACVAAILFRKPLVAAEVVFIGMVGECLESFTFDRTRRALGRLVEVFPRRCWLIRDGQEIRVLTKDLQVGDRVVVKPGARLPVDGVVIDGHSSVDASALTGESFPVDKGPGEDVLAGTVNQYGALVIEARRVAEHTIAGRVIELTAKALQDKASLERTADRLARYFLPAVLGLAALTFLAGLFLNMAGRTLSEAAAKSIDPMLAVLVVACPCALILATPAAIIAALGRLAGTGVLIKGGSSLERLAQVNAFVFDKTGTLTEGRLALGDVVALPEVGVDDLLGAAATAEQNSEHVLARLILHEAGTRGLALSPLSEFQAHPGAGVTARTSSGPIVVGTRRLLEDNGIAIPPETLAAAATLEAAGQTTLLVARAGVLLGVIGARDQTRPEAVGVIGDLRSLGIHDIALLTGDRAPVARSLANDLGITVVEAELLPHEKAEFIESWTRESVSGSAPRRLAMVGDGINDAPALARAHVGLAIGGAGADLAAEAGDLVLMGDPLRPLPLLLRLSRETVRIIRQNIFIFAFGVNGVGIVLTAWLWPLLAPSAEWAEQAPLAGVIYHQFGSLAVLLNSMRLLWFDKKATTFLGMRHRLERFDQWLEHHVDLHESFHWLSHHGRAMGLGFAALAIILYLASGLTQIGPDEVAVVRRFGRALAPELGPGLHYRLPWPLEIVTRAQPDRIRTVEIGFRSLPGAAAITAPLTWASSHGANVQRIPEEAVMITGDGNLVELQATVRYSIQPDQLAGFLFDIRAPDDIIRAAAESVIRETVAGRPFLDLLTAARADFQDDVSARLAERCRGYGDGGLGITLDGVTLHDLHPPQEVVPSYYEVTKAMESRDRQVNEAEAEKIRAKRQAEVKRDQTIYQAQAEAKEIVSAADAARARFLSRLKTRGKLGRHEETRLAADALHGLVNGQAPASVYRDYERRRGELIALQASLTDFRLFWEALGDSLTGREKILIDADKVPGRRHLFLVDPDQFRVPVPLLPQSSRPSRGED